MKMEKNKDLASPFLPPYNWRRDQYEALLADHKWEKAEKYLGLLEDFWKFQLKSLTILKYLEDKKDNL